MLWREYFPFYWHLQSPRTRRGWKALNALTHLMHVLLTALTSNYSCLEGWENWHTEHLGSYIYYTLSLLYSSLLSSLMSGFFLCPHKLFFLLCSADLPQALSRWIGTYELVLAVLFCLPRSGKAQRLLQFAHWVGCKERWLNYVDGVLNNFLTAFSFTDNI